MATGDVEYNPPLEGGSVETKDDGASVVTTTTAIDFVDGTGFEFAVTDQGNGVTRVVGNVTGGASGAPETAQYVTLATNATLTAERVLTPEATVLTLTDAGAGSTVTVGVAALGITAAKLAADAVTTSKILDANVTRAKLEADAIDGTKLADDAVDSEHIADGAIDPAHLAALAVETAAIAGDAVTDAKLRNSGALSVIGRAANSAGDPADISAAANGRYLQRNADALSFAAIAAADLPATADTNARVSVAKNSGAEVGKRRQINFIEGSNVTLTVADDAGNEQVDVTIASSGGGGGAPTDASYVVLGLNGTLSDERTLAAESSVLTLTDGGAGAAATIGVATNGITDAKFRQGAALSVVGVTGNATANVADIAAGTDGHVLRRSGTALAFGTVVAGGLASDAVTTAKILDANVTAAKLASDSVETAKILNDNVTDSKLRNSGARSVIGRSANSSGDPADISGGGAGQYLSDDGSTLAFRRILPREVTLTDGANVAVNAALIGQGDAFVLTLGGNRTVDAPTNETAGQWMTIVIRQDATGSRTITWDSGAGGYRFTTTVTSPTLSTAANKFDYILFRYNATDDKWDCMAFNQSA